MTTLAAIEGSTRSKLLDDIASLIFDIVEGFIDCVALRDDHNNGIDNPAPPAHPSELVTLKGRDVAQKERLDASFDKIGLQFRALCTEYRTEESLQTAIDSCEHTSSFDSAWSEQGLIGRFDELARFVSSLTSPFTNTAPVASDFSIIKFRKDVFNKSLTDYSLEGFLQFKQYDMLMRLNNKAPLYSSLLRLRPNLSNLIWIWCLISFVSGRLGNVLI